MTLLSVSFLTSYSWQPVSLDTSLSTPWPWADNITTFRDGLLLLLTNTSATPTLNLTAAEALLASEPDLKVTLIDRGWLSLPSDKSLFSPFNVTKWEWQSIQKAKTGLLARHREFMPESTNKSSNSSESTPDTSASNSSAVASTSDGAPALPISVPQTTSTASFRQWFKLFMYPHPKQSMPEPPRPAASAEPGGSPTPPDLSGGATQATLLSAPKLPKLRREYDLSPYGIDAIFDFGWSR
jgi:hypothetical protein